MYAVQIDRAR